MPQVRIVARNFMDMVAALPAAKLDKLYDSSFICEAVLRSLPPLAKKYVLQMLFLDSSLAAKSMEEWVLPDGLSKHKVAIDRLLQLRVFMEVNDRKKEPSYKMNQKFQSNMQKYLTTGGTLPREPMPLNAAVRLPSVVELETYAMEQWESFLLQLINSSQVDKSTSFSSSMMRAFQRGLLNSRRLCNVSYSDVSLGDWKHHSYLVAPFQNIFEFPNCSSLSVDIDAEGRDNEAPRLTENGFQFLLMETNAQLWYIIREYISSAEERGMDPTDLISFLLELSFHTTGEAYSVNTLTEVQRLAIKDLADLGLVKYLQGRKEALFMPTKLATNLSVSLSDASSRKEGFVVVETNFRMYAYSSSRLHCEILRLFSRIEYQLPNLIVGAITKESLYNAFENGITAEQIVSFLQQNAHPRVAEKMPTVPENVTDQIRLWEADRNRVEMTPSHLYEDFPSKDLFEACCDFARDYGGLLWQDTKKMRLIVKGELHQQMRDFLRGQR